jgi:hypothetical protein
LTKVIAFTKTWFLLLKVPLTLEQLCWLRMFVCAGQQVPGKLVVSSGFAKGVIKQLGVYRPEGLKKGAQPPLND